MFHIADVSKLRIYVQVPQGYAPAVTSELSADLLFNEHPGKTFTGKLVDSAHAFDPATRTLLVQFAVDNAQGELMPGGYTEAHLKLPSSAGSMRLPVNTLVFRSSGMQVAIVGEDGIVQMKNITIGRDFGKEVEVVSGLAATDSIIINPPDSLITGEKVRIAPPAKEEPKKDEKKS
jgi:RND family efflux transporter MFP subunit